MTPRQIERWMLANNVREVRYVPTPSLGQGSFHWDVLLRGGGVSGIGNSVAEALERARDANAEWLDAA